MMKSPTIQKTVMGLLAITLCNFLVSCDKPSEDSTNPSETSKETEQLKVQLEEQQAESKRLANELSMEKERRRLELKTKEFFNEKDKAAAETVAKTKKQESNPISNTPLAKDFESLRKKYDATEKDAILEKRLEKDKYYFIAGTLPGGQEGWFSITQVGDDFIFVSGNQPPKPWAILMFENQDALSGVQIRTDSGRTRSWGKAIGKFVEFRAVAMANGSEQRFPVFSCVGLQLGENDFVNTEAVSK